MMGAIVDFHSHILPAMDDGSRTPQESIAMLEMEKEQGIDRVLATPHFDARVDIPEAFLRRRAEAKTILDNAVSYCPGLPAVTLGAEVRYFPGMSHCDVLEGLTIEGTKTILIEMPFTPWESSHYRELEGLRGKLGLLPVVMLANTFPVGISTGIQLGMLALADLPAAWYYRKTVNWKQLLSPSIHRQKSPGDAEKAADPSAGL